MQLTEIEGKELFSDVGINIPKGTLLQDASDPAEFLSKPCVLKAQVHFGDRKKHGLIKFPKNKTEFQKDLETLFKTPVHNETPESVLLEELLEHTAEHYLSITYDIEYRSPVLLFSKDGGSGIDAAGKIPIAIEEGPERDEVTSLLTSAGISENGHSAHIADIVGKLWKLFIEHDALLAEINPLALLRDGNFVALDAKVILDDARYNPHERRFIAMDGDIAILASGGGASMYNMDALLTIGGKPANYTEYSGNPPREEVKALTKRTLERGGLKGLWVVGGFANFTDIFETLSGFVEALKEIKPKPAYPIVIRRDGPRSTEAFEMLKKVQKNDGFDLHLYGSETSMTDSAKIMVEKAYKKKV